MNCAWKAYLSLLPVGIRSMVEDVGYHSLTEVRLRCGQCPELITDGGSSWLNTLTTKEELRFTVNIASQYSAWVSNTAAYGFITAAGGHRIGVCGQVVSDGKGVLGIREAMSLCIRVAKDLAGIAEPVAGLPGSTLIIGRPGCGKSTFLRDLVRQKSQKQHVAVVDERQELFPIAGGTYCFETGAKTDVMSGCGKAEGILMLIRSMNPDYIAVDEITDESDCQSLIKAGGCGVSILATAHAADKNDLYKRPVYKQFLDNGLFDNLVVLRPDHTFCIERMVS